MKNRTVKFKRLIAVIIFIQIYSNAGSDRFKPAAEPVFNEKETAWLKKNRNRRIIIGTENYSDWLNYKSDNPDDYGYLTHVINLLNSRYGLNLTVNDRYNYDDLYRDLDAGGVDGVLNCDENLLNDNYYWTIPLAVTNIKCFSRDKKLNSLDKLENRTAGFLYSQPSYTVIKKYYPSLRIKPRFYISRYELISALDRGEVDVLFSTRDVFLTQKKLHSFHLPLHNRKYVLTFRKIKGNEYLVSIINKTLKYHDSTGDLESFKNHAKDSFAGFLLKKTFILSEREKLWLSRNSEVKIGFPDGFTPAVYRDSNGEVKGVSFDILKLLLDNLKIKYTFYTSDKGSSWSSLKNDLSLNKFDIMPFIVKEDPGDGEILATTNYGYTDYIIVGRAGSKYISNVHDLDGKKISVLQNEWLVEKLHKYFYKSDLIEKRDISEVLKSVSTGESDYAIGAKNIIIFNTSKYSENLKISGIYGTDIPVSFGVNSSHPELVSMINKMLFMIDFNDFFNRYNSVNLKEDSYRYFIYISLGLVLILIVMGWYTYIMHREIIKRITAETQLENANSELLIAIESSERASIEKNQFFANVSHDIRTPLNSIIGFSDILDMNIRDSGTKQYVDIIKKSGKMLLNIVNDIIDIAKIDSNELKITPVETSIRDMFRNLERMFEIETDSKGLDLIFETGDTLPVVIMIDENRLNQILVNLISNSVKFTDLGFIKVTAESTLSISGNIDLTIRVIDTGIGINDDYRNRIFQTFQQYISDSSRNIGAGLGLAISKKISGLMNGEIYYDSIEGAGTTFTLLFKNLEWKSIRTPAETVEKSIPLSLCFRSKKILVVDDVESNRLLIKTYLKKFRCEIYTAVNGAEAVTMVSEIIPDAIFMDIWMPVMNGIEAARIIKGSEATCNIPIIALSASVKNELGNTELDLFDDYLMKPVKIAGIAGSLLRFIKPD